MRHEKHRKPWALIKKSNPAFTRIAKRKANKIKKESRAKGNKG
jgi:hypothetical protein